MHNREKYGFDIGDRVCHIKEPDIGGTIVNVDCSPYKDVTTVGIIWDDGDGKFVDTQWTNRICLLEKQTFS